MRLNCSTAFESRLIRPWVSRGQLSHLMRLRLWAAGAFDAEELRGEDTPPDEEECVPEWLPAEEYEEEVPEWLPR